MMLTMKTADLGAVAAGGSAVQRQQTGNSFANQGRSAQNQQPAFSSQNTNNYQRNDSYVNRSNSNNNPFPSAAATAGAAGASMNESVDRRQSLRTTSNATGGGN